MAKLEEAVYVLHVFVKKPKNPEARDRARENEMDRDQGAEETAMKGITHVTPADGNVFADLGLKDQPFQGDARPIFRLAMSLAMETCGVFGSLWRLGGGFLGPRGCLRIADILTFPARKISHSTI